MPRVHLATIRWSRIVAAARQSAPCGQEQCWLPQVFLRGSGCTPLLFGALASCWLASLSLSSLCHFHKHSLEGWKQELVMWGTAGVRLLEIISSWLMLAPQMPTPAWRCKGFVCAPRYWCCWAVPAGVHHRCVRQRSPPAVSVLCLFFLEFQSITCCFFPLHWIIQ